MHIPLTEIANIELVYEMESDTMMIEADGIGLLYNTFKTQYPDLVSLYDEIMKLIEVNRRT